MFIELQLYTVCNPSAIQHIDSHSHIIMQRNSIRIYQHESQHVIHKCIEKIILLSYQIYIHGLEFVFTKSFITTSDPHPAHTIHHIHSHPFSFRNASWGWKLYMNLPSTSNNKFVLNIHNGISSSHIIYMAIQKVDINCTCMYFVYNSKNTYSHFVVLYWNCFPVSIICGFALFTAAEDIY